MCRLWAFINDKVSGLVLPSKPDDQSDEDYEDQMIEMLIDVALKDLEYNGHPVVSVAVPCVGSEVEIEGQVI